MDLYNKAFEVLQTSTFDKKRYLAAVKLYRKAKGVEKNRIGELFESQLVLVEPKDLDWLSKVNRLFNSGVN